MAKLGEFRSPNGIRQPSAKPMIKDTIKLAKGGPLNKIGKKDTTMSMPGYKGVNPGGAKPGNTSVDLMAKGGLVKRKKKK